MIKILVLALSLVLYATIASAGNSCGAGEGFVCEPCKDANVCPECFQNPPNKPTIKTQCCQQYSHVIALTAASVQASANAFAGAQAAAVAATKVTVSAGTGVAVGAFVSIAQAVSLSVNLGKCCEVSSDVAANASSYAQSFAYASAEAKAGAQAAAAASSGASSAAAAAASLFAQAESLIKGSCCGFDLEVYSKVTAAGNYAIRAQSVAQAAVQVSTAALETSKSLTEASATAQTGTNSIVSAKIDNCCKDSYTSTIARATANACETVLTKAKELHGYVSIAYDSIKSYASDSNAIKTPVYLKDKSNSTECNDVPLSCCSNRPLQAGCGKDTDATGGVVAKTIADVYLAVQVTTKAVAQAAASAKSRIAVYTDSLAFANAAAQSASSAATSINVDVKACCSIVVTVSNQATASGKAFAQAISKAKAAAQAYAAAQSASFSTSDALAQAKAIAKAVVIAYANGAARKSCCNNWNYLGYKNNNNKQYTCAELSELVVAAYSQEYINLIAKAHAAASEVAKSSSVAAKSTSSSDCTNLIKRVSTKSSFLLQCCCCTTKNAQTTAESKNSYTEAQKLNPAQVAELTNLFGKNNNNQGKHDYNNNNNNNNNNSGNGGHKNNIGGGFSGYI